MKVLLFGNIGTSPENFFHVGDEDMFLQTYYWYKKHFPKADISIFSSQKNHQKLNLNEYDNFLLPTNRYIQYYIAFFVRLLIYRYLNKNYFSLEEFTFINRIFAVNIVHFSGGGNINSLDRNWLYYSFLVILIAKFFYKKIILTSQTIGPFLLLDLPIVLIALNLADSISQRQPSGNLLKYGVFRPKQNYMLDSAYYFDTPSQIKKTNKIPTIGLSIHKESHIDINKFNLALASSLGNKKCNLVLIPHITGNKYWDLDFMINNIKVPSNCRIIIPKINTKSLQQIYIPKLIKKLTSQCDLTINTRYHGVIYSLSSNIPAIGIYKGNYYQTKIYNAFKFLYQNPNSYIINLKQKFAYSKLELKNKELLINIDAESKRIYTVNKKLSRNFDLFYYNNSQFILSPDLFTTG